jgi:broad specificity phosphatase PhoE
MASLLLCSSFSVIADHYSIYLVRHAEKIDNSKNPSLTNCGKKRAQHLSTMLSKADISAIYSTTYQRTIETAEPLATLQQLKIQNYDPSDLEKISHQLQQEKKNTLIVGHSNTTPVLTELLAQQKVAPLTEEDYQYLYQVQFVNNQPLLTIFQQPRNCSTSKTLNKS